MLAKSGLRGGRMCRLGDSSVAPVLPPMNTSDPVLPRQRPIIAKIIADETWLEAERRGCPVDSRDPVVLGRVCDIVQRDGGAIRHHVQCEMAAGR